MNIWNISIKNIKTKPFYTCLSIIILALSVALLLGIQQLKSSFKYQMDNNLGKIDLVIGAKGSPLQLILASVLHLDNPTGNISYNKAKKLIKNPLIKSAVPISYGDNYKGFRIVGTEDTFYSLYDAKLDKGHTVQKPMEVVIGSNIAKQLGLKIGDIFSSSHGLIENTIDIHDDKLTVVGILKPTQKIIDRLIVTNLHSIWDVHDHENKNHIENEHHHDIEPHDEKEITSLLINFRNPRAFLTFPRKVNESSNMQAAIPKYELDRLYEYTSIGFKTITWIAYLILIISGVTIFINLYKMVKERAFDLALLRTYGANNFQIIKMVVYEAVTIVFIAFILGYILIKTGLHYVLKFTNFGYKQNMIQDLGFQDILQTALFVFIIITLSVMLAVYPILKMNISTILSNEK